MSGKVLIVGGTGFIGRSLQNSLRERSISFNILSRNPQNGYFWDIQNKKIDLRALDNVTRVVYLAGAGLAEQKITEERKKELEESRIEGTLFLKEIVEANCKIDSFIGASAVGVYGTEISEKIFTENDKSTTHDYGTELCEKWETAHQKWNEICKRTCIIRIPLVFGKDGGSYPQLALPAKFGAAAAIGSGKQYVSWIHVHDLGEIIATMLTNESYNGTYNVCASECVTNSELTGKLAKSFGMPYLLPNIPQFAMNLLVGDIMSELICGGSRISNEKLVKSGCKFKYPKLEQCLDDLAK